MDDVTKHEGNYTFEDRAHRDFRNTLDDIQVQSHRRSDQPHFGNTDNEYAEPDGVYPDALGEWEKNGHRQQHDRHRIHEAAQQDHDKKDADQNKRGAGYDGGYRIG